MKKVHYLIVAGILLFAVSCKDTPCPSSISAMVADDPSTNIPEVLRIADSVYRTDTITYPALADSTIQKLVAKHNEPILIDDSTVASIAIATHDLMKIIYQPGDTSNPRGTGDSLIFKLAVYRDSIDVARYNETTHQNATLNGPNGIKERPTLLIKLITPTDPDKTFAPGRLCPPPKSCGPAY